MKHRYATVSFLKSKVALCARVSSMVFFFFLSLSSSSSESSLSASFEEDKEQQYISLSSLPFSPNADKSLINTNSPFFSISRYAFSVSSRLPLFVEKFLLTFFFFFSKHTRQISVKSSAVSPPLCSSFSPFLLLEPVVVVNLYHLPNSKSMPH